MSHGPWGPRSHPQGPRGRHWRGRDPGGCPWWLVSSLSTLMVKTSSPAHLSHKAVGETATAYGPDRYRPNRSASLRSFAGTTLSERVEKSLSSKREKDTESPKRYLSVPGFSARRCRAQVGLRTLGSSDHGPGTGSGEAVGKSGRFQFGTPSWPRFSLVTVAVTSSPLRPVPAQMGRGGLIDT